MLHAAGRCRRARSRRRRIGGEALIRLTDGVRTAPTLSAATPKRSLRVARLALLAIPLLVLAAASPAGADAVATVIPPDGLNLRAAPGTQYPALDLVPGGTRVGITGAALDGGWYPAVYKGKRGFVRGDFLDLSTDATAITRRATVRSAEGAHLRHEPHTGAISMTTMANGTAITVSLRATSDGWVLAAHGGLTGWVSADLLQIEGAPASTPMATVPAGGAAVRATITYYHPSLEGGAMACGGRYRAEDPTIAATTSWPCGTRLRVCRNSACIVVTVQDSGHMGPNWVDLSTSAFRQLGPLPDMLLIGTVEVLPPGP